jgi:SAM-dependent methyltransferase
MPASREMAARDWDRVAADYFAEIVSPLRDGVPRALLRALDAIPNARRKTVGDLGCGIGTLLPTLAARFRRVVGIDFSAAMLARARDACPDRTLALHRADLADLATFRATLDVAVTVNAVLTPDGERLDRIFEALATVLRPGGVLLGIFPAMEPVLYQGFLIHERERRRHDPTRARRRTSRILERAKYDFVHGTYRDGTRAQKFFYGFELTHRLRRAGFRRVRLGTGHVSLGGGRRRLRELPGRAADVGLARARGCGPAAGSAMSRSCRACASPPRSPRRATGRRRVRRAVRPRMAASTPGRVPIT